MHVRDDIKTIKFIHSVAFSSVTIMSISRVIQGISTCKARYYLPLVFVVVTTTTYGNDEIIDLPIESLLGLKVSGASKFQQAVANAPSSVIIATQQDIKVFGWRTLGDALASMRGVQISNDLNYSYLGARGFARPSDYNTRFLLLIDGIKANDSLYDQAAVGLDSPIDMELVERIEYIPGSASAVYGSNAFFGVINIITKTADSFNGRPYAAVSIGSAGERKATAVLSKRDDEGRQFLISTTTYRRNGNDIYFSEFDSPGTNNGIANRLDSEKSGNVLIKGNAGPVSILISHVERRKGIPTASYEQTFNDGRSHTDDDQTNAAISYEKESDDSTLLGRLVWGQHRYNGLYTYDSYINLDGSQSSWFGGEINYLVNRWKDHKLLMGAEIQRDYKRIQRNSDIVGGDATTNLSTNNPDTRVAAFIQDEIKLSKQFLVNVGSRFDYHSQTSSAFSPRLAVIYQPTSDTTLKVINGRAFRSPNAYEMFYQVDAPGGQLGNTSLQPERVRSHEFVWEQLLSSSSRFTTSAFHNQTTNLIALTDDGLGRPMFKNLNQVDTQGIEFEYENTWMNRANLKFSQSWQRAKDNSTGVRAVNSPMSLSKLNLQVPVARTPFIAGLEMRYVGERKGLAGNVSSYLLTNLTLYASQILKDCDLSLSIYNLLDKQYGDPGAFEHRQNMLIQQGRTFRMKLSRSF